MEKLVSWLNDKFAPALYKVTGSRWINSIMTGFQSTIGLIIVGALFEIIINLTGLFGLNLSALAPAYNFTFGIIALYLSYTIGTAMALHHGIKNMTAGLASIAVTLILLRPTVDKNSILSIDITRLGTAGFFIAIVSGLFVGEVIGQFMSRHWTVGSKGLPDFVKEWFEPIVPLGIVIFVSWLVADGFNIDLYNLIAVVISPLLSGANTYIAWLLLCFFLTALFVIGINGSVTFGILMPLWMASVGENAAMFAHGLAPTNVNTLQTLMGWVMLGGTGATLMLNILLLRSKSKGLRTLGRATIIPSIMNINEPVIYGLPIAFNPILGIPFILNAGIINPTLVYFAMHFGLVRAPITALMMPWCPVGINTFLFDNDWRGIVLVIIELAITLVVWYPFFKTFERSTLRKEAEEEANGDEDDSTSETFISTQVVELESIEHAAGNS